MHFQAKNTLKNNLYYILKHLLNDIHSLLYEVGISSTKYI